MEKRNFLITGLPGTGKTTLIKDLAARLKDVNAAGFYTEEIRAGGARKGFEIVDLRGKRAILSHVDIVGNSRVGKYGVDVEGLERYLKASHFLSPQTDLVVIDEIGRMECLSPVFRQMVARLLDAPVVVVATIALHGGDIIEVAKKRADVRLYTVTRENRNSLPGEIERVVRGSLT